MTKLYIKIPRYIAALKDDRDFCLGEKLTPGLYGNSPYRKVMISPRSLEYQRKQNSISQFLSINYFLLLTIISEKIGTSILKHLSKLGLVLLAAILIQSCSKENKIVDPVDDVTDPPVNFSDTASIEAIALNLNNYIPTWKELERFTNETKRLSLPNYVVRGLTGPPGWGSDINISKTLNYFDQIITEWKSDYSNSLYSLIPPYLEKDSLGGYKELVYPLKGKILDEKLRAATVVALRERSLGRPTIFVNFYPPSQEDPHFSSEADFRKWLDEEFIQEKVAEAKAAEIMKAEAMIAWPLEFELFMKALGGLENNGFMSNYSDDQILNLAHEVKNKIRDEVKKHYTGKLVAHSYWNYVSQDSLWDKFDYKGFDEIHFAFFPKIDVQATSDYMDTQLRHYKKVIEQSGNIPWIASEITLFRKSSNQVDLSKIEKDIYQTVFEKLENAPIPPAGISVGVYTIETEEARNFIKNYMNSK